MIFYNQERDFLKSSKAITSLDIINLKYINIWGDVNGC